MSRAKIAILVILVLITFIIILQNTKSVETKILFFSIVMPRIVLLVLSLAVGFVLGILYRTKREKRVEE
jgi:uncharacterized integral membrane protein